jgi:hypothetical protein
MEQLDLIPRDTAPAGIVGDDAIAALPKVKSPCCRRVSEARQVGGYLVRWFCPCGRTFKAKDTFVRGGTGNADGNL